MIQPGGRAKVKAAASIAARLPIDIESVFHQLIVNHTLVNVHVLNDRIDLVNCLLIKHLSRENDLTVSDRRFHGLGNVCIQR